MHLVGLLHDLFPITSRSVSSCAVTFPNFTGDTPPCWIKHLWIAQYCFALGLLFHPPIFLTALKKVPGGLETTCMSADILVYHSEARWMLKITRLSILTANPRTDMLRLLRHKRIPWVVCILRSKSLVLVRTAVTRLNLTNVSRLLNPLAFGDRLWNVSNKRSMVLIKNLVHSLPVKSEYHRWRMTDKAEATDALSVCAASFTFIFLLGKENMWR